MTAAGLLVAMAACGRADEGMWLFSAPPAERLVRDHGVRLTDVWLERLQRSCVRVNSGGSGAFVSADGLVLTNHHVAAQAIQKLGTASRDLLRDGFQARTLAEELACPGLELNVLVSIADVTDRVQAAVTTPMSAEEAAAARRAVMATIEQESLAASGLRSDVITLYQGGAFHLYRFRRYTDVRLVFAPEQQIAFFGGDVDNFEFPRFDLDICLLRAYDEGRPARVPHHLSWASKPAVAGDLVFVAGHPGNTDRRRTVAELLSMRDRSVPFQLQTLNRLETLLTAYSQRGPEERRQARADLCGVQNGRKSREGLLAGLLDPAIVDRLRAAEAAERTALERTAGAGPSPYRRIERAQAELDRILVRHRMVEGALAFNSRLFAHARTILRAADEEALPSPDRLREYRDSNRVSLALDLFSDEPLHDAYEIAKLSDSLTAFAAACGGDDPTVKAVLAGRTPQDRAAELVTGSRLGRRVTADGSPAPADQRRTLSEGGRDAIARSADPMLAVARLVDAEARELRTVAEAAEEVKRQAHGELAAARFAREGAAAAPDATFSLRLSYGTVAGYEDAGRRVEAFTTFAGLFARATDRQELPPFDLPARWRRERPRLEADAGFMATPLNVVSTADIIGGNSGSPVVDRTGALVAVIFDGNLQSLAAGIAYDDRRARAIAVEARGILAALERVYAADALVAELMAGRLPGR